MKERKRGGGVSRPLISQPQCSRPQRRTTVNPVGILWDYCSDMVNTKILLKHDKVPRSSPLSATREVPADVSLSRL